MPRTFAIAVAIALALSVTGCGSDSSEKRPGAEKNNGTDIVETPIEDVDADSAETDLGAEAQPETTEQEEPE